MSKVEIEFSNQKVKNYTLPLWVAEGNELYQIIPLNSNEYILFDPSEDTGFPTYIRYESIGEIIDEYPHLKPVDVKITVS